MTQEPRNRRIIGPLGFLAAIFAGCGSPALGEPEVLPGPWRADPAPSARHDSADSARRAGSVAPCSDDLGHALARLACDGGHVAMAAPIELHPDASEPSEPTRGVLHAVARELARHPEVLLIRIEVWATGGRSRAAAQERADALLRWLWRRERISAERLEAVGLADAPDPRAVGTTHPVLLRVLARARFPNSAH